MTVAQAVLKKRLWPYPLIWAVPVLVAVAAGLYFKKYLDQEGPEIVIEFSDASGLNAGQTRLLYRGAEVGRVTAIDLSEDRKRSLVTARLQKREAIFATKGATFWIVRPDISQGTLSGMDTLMTGPYLHAVPGGGGETVTEFEGLRKAPLSYEEGTNFLLTSVRLGHVQEGSSVDYKGIPVGRVQTIELAKDASRVEIGILVWRRYAHLIRENSKFWLENGFDVKGGLFSGIHVALDSLQTLASGGIAFATPEKEVAGVAKEGSSFAIEDDPKSEWEKWSPKIHVVPRRVGIPDPLEKAALPVEKH
jgi:paraquat-inducible protein B